MPEKYARILDLILGAGKRFSKRALPSPARPEGDHAQIMLKQKDRAQVWIQLVGLRL